MPKHAGWEGRDAVVTETNTAPRLTGVTVYLGTQTLNKSYTNSYLARVEIVL